MRGEDGREKKEERRDKGGRKEGRDGETHITAMRVKGRKCRHNCRPGG